MLTPHHATTCAFNVQNNLLLMSKPDRFDVCLLTLNCSDNTVAIFYQLLEKFAGPLQLQFITLESLSELRTVQIAVTEFQRRMPHLLDELVLDNRNT